MHSSHWHDRVQRYKEPRGAAEQAERVQREGREQETQRKGTATYLEVPRKLCRIVTQLENESTYHSWKLDFKEMDTLKKLLTWPK